MKRTKRIVSYRVKVFLIYLIVTIIPILSFVGIVETQYVSHLRNQAFESLDNSADMLVNTFDDCFDQIVTTANGLIILGATSQDYLPAKPAEANAFRTRLSIYVHNGSLFDEIALYSSNNEFLFSNKSSYTTERFLQLKSLDYFNKEQIYEFVKESYGPVVLPAGGEYAFCVLYPIHMRGGAQALFFSFPITKLDSYVRNVLQNNEGYCQFTDSEGRILLSCSTSENIPEPNIIEQCINGERSVKQGKDTWYCANAKSTVTGMSFSIMINNGSVHESIDSIRWKWGILILSSIMLTFVASWITSFINAKPIVNLSKRIASDILQREKGSNEIEHIDASISHLNDVAINMKKQMDELGDYLAFRLLCGTIESVDEANQLSKMLGTSIYADTYQVCIVDSGENHSANEIADRIRSLLPPEVSSLTRAFGTVYVCVFFCSLDDQNTMDVFCERFLQYYPQGKLAFGNGYSQLAEVPVSFMEAYLASKNEESSVASFAYSDTLLREIDVFAKATETADVHRMLDSLSHVHCSIEQEQYNLLEGKCLYVRFSHILSFSSFAGRLSNFLPNAYIVISSDSVEMLLKTMELAIKELKAMQSTPMENPMTSPLVDQMVNYLAANYRNPNFSLQQMAFDFRLTPSALSRYFKENFGRNINDYMNNLKMERAKQLLLETSLPIYEVGLELGYQGPNSFIRRFKATYGITPGEFRQEGLRER